MGSYYLWGVHELGARFPSAGLGVVTVLATYEIGRRLFSARHGLWAGLILATTVLFGVVARAATPDSTLVACCTLALLVYVRAAFPAPEVVDVARHAPDSHAVRHPSSRRLRSGFFPARISTTAAMYALMGLATLAKGPVGVLLPTAVIGMFLLIVGATPEAPDAGRRTWKQHVAGCLRALAPIHFLRTCWRMRPITALLAALAVSLPWYVWVSWRTEGEWIQRFLLEHNVGRALQPMEGHSGPALLYYPLTILVGCFPWSIVTIPVALQVTGIIRRRERSSTACLFLVCWVGVYVALFSVARTKLPSYIAPCYPGLALLVAGTVDRWATGQRVPAVWLKVGLASLIGVGLFLGLILPVATHYVLPGSQWIGTIGLIPVVGGGLCWLLLNRAANTWATRILAGTAVAFATVLTVVIPAEVGRHQQASQLWRVVPTNGVRLAAVGDLEPSWVFYSRRPVFQLRDGQGEALAQLSREGQPLYVVTTQERVPRLKAHLPDSHVVLATAPYFLEDEALVVLGPPGEPAPKVARTSDHPLR
jgi:4-amino-4-deoxy-L-arabinose transferase-like glycosyltransferase